MQISFSFNVKRADQKYAVKFFMMKGEEKDR